MLEEVDWKTMNRKLVFVEPGDVSVTIDGERLEPGGKGPREFRRMELQGPHATVTCSSAGRIIFDRSGIVVETPSDP